MMSWCPWIPPLPSNGEPALGPCSPCRLYISPAALSFTLIGSQLQGDEARCHSYAILRKCVHRNAVACIPLFLCPIFTRDGAGK